MKDVPSQPIAETITPLGPPKKYGGGDHNKNSRRFLLKALLLVSTFILLLLGGGWLLHLLSRDSIQFQEAVNTPLPFESKVKKKPLEMPEASQAEVDPVKLGLEKTDAEQELADYLEAKDKLDQKAASEWGGKIYREMTDLAKQADTHFLEKQYFPASDLYLRARSLAEKLANQTKDVLRRLLAEGQTALEDGHGPLARQNFSLALKIEPGNPKAQSGLKRAGTIESVLNLIDSGRQHEANNALSLAREEYGKALEIDPDSAKARTALHRVDGLIQEKDFQQLMSDGLAAFHQNDFKLARTLLLKAKSLKPESREAGDALLQADQAIRLSSIDKLRNKAQAAERSENWQRALKSYLAVLDIDKNLQFAVHGKKRALEQIQIAKRINFFLDAPQTLQSDSQLKNAVFLLEEANEIEPRGPHLTARIKKLAKLVEIAQTPVKIAIESDNLTRVAVYKVGKLGRFSVHELELRPGTYTVVGSRDGYQDVRQKLVVKPGLQSLRITVKCRVKI